MSSIYRVGLLETTSRKKAHELWVYGNGPVLKVTTEKLEFKWEVVVAGEHYVLNENDRMVGAVIREDDTDGWWGVTGGIFRWSKSLTDARIDVVNRYCEYQDEL